MKKILKGIAVIFLVSSFSVILESCNTSSTVITGVWQQDTDKTYSNILIAALTDQMNFRATVEEDLEQSIENVGASAKTSIDILPPRFIEEDTKKSTILNRVKEDGIDGILTLALVAEETETRYVPGSYAYAPYPTYPYYGRFWSYYDYWYPRFDVPGYYTEKNTYYIETNLYDADTEELVWSAQSETYNPGYLETFSEGLADEIIASLVSDKLLATSQE